MLPGGLQCEADPRLVIRKFVCVCVCMCFFCLPCLGLHLGLIGGTNWRGCRARRKFALAGCACYTIVPIASSKLWIMQLFMAEMSCRRWWHLYCTHMALSVPLLWVTCLCHRRWIVTTCLPPSLALFKSSLFVDMPSVSSYSEVNCNSVIIQTCLFLLHSFELSIKQIVLCLGT